MRYRLCCLYATTFNNERLKSLHSNASLHIKLHTLNAVDQLQLALPNYGWDKLHTPINELQQVGAAVLRLAKLE